MSAFIIVFLHIVILLFLSYCFYRTYSSSLKLYYWPCLILKISSGILYGFLYLYYYNGGDTWGYFHQSVGVASKAKDNILLYFQFLFLDEHQDFFKITYSSIYQARAYWMVKAISPFSLITHNNYWLMSCYLSLFSFWGTYYLSETLVELYRREKTTLLISFLLFPTFVFWSSGVSKESIGIGCLFYLMAIVFRVYKSDKLRWVHLILIPLAGWILWKIRFFYLVTMILTVGVFLIYIKFERILKLNTLKALSLSILSGLIILLILSHFEYALNFSNILDAIVYSSKNQFQNNPDNAIEFWNLEPTIKSLTINTPLALISGLFRPSILDSGNPLMQLVGLENLILLLLLLTRLHFLRYSKLEIAIWGFIIILAVLLALSSPNFGSLTRYKVAFLPFFLFLLLKEHPLLERVGKFFKKSPYKNL